MNTNDAQTNIGTDRATLPGGGDEQVLQRLAIHQRRLKWLTGIAVGFWAMAVLVVALVLICYAVFVAPKEKQIMNDFGLYGRLVDRSAAAPGQTTTLEPPTQNDRALGVGFTMTYVVMKGVLVVAVAVLILSCGTLTTLLLVLFNRRVTLGQISYSLAQISRQLEELQAKQPA